MKKWSDNYRIHRVDPKNIAIQKCKGDKIKRWETISYHGNSVTSLISGLFELIMAHYTPESDNVLESLETFKLELVKGIREVEKMIKRDCDKIR